MKWKIATASVVTAAIVSAPVAGAAPADNNTVPNIVVGQGISQVTGVDAGIILDGLTQVQRVLKRLGIGKTQRGNGNGAALQEATLANIGKTLKKPGDEAAP